MKVRARVKAREYLPEWCAEECSDYRHAIATFGEFVVDLSDKTEHLHCVFCGKVRHTIAVRRLPLNQYRWIPLELLDLDEVPLDDPKHRSGIYLSAEESA